jgi:hypothetical protein
MYQCCSTKVAEKVMAIHCGLPTHDRRNMMLCNEKYFFEQYIASAAAIIQVNKRGKE